MCRDLARNAREREREMCDGCGTMVAKGKLVRRRLNTSGSRVFKLNYCLAINGRSNSGVRQVMNQRKVRPVTRHNAISAPYMHVADCAAYPANDRSLFEMDATLTRGGLSLHCVRCKAKYNKYFIDGVIPQVVNRIFKRFYFFFYSTSRLSRAKYFSVLFINFVGNVLDSGLLSVLKEIERERVTHGGGGIEEGVRTRSLSDFNELRICCNIPVAGSLIYRRHVFLYRIFLVPAVLLY